MAEYLFQLAAGIGDQRAGIVFAARQRAGNRDHPHLRRAERADAPLRRGLETVEAILLEDLVLHAHQHDLCGIDHRTTTDRYNQISFGVLGLPGHVDHHLAGGVLWDAVEGPGMTIAQRLADVLDLFGGGVEGTADNEIDALRA